MWGHVWPFSHPPLFGFHGNVCLRETPSMLATDRCFWTLSLLWLRMFLLGDEPLFFLLSLSSSVDAGDGYKVSRLLKWSLWKLGSSKQPLADSLAGGDAGPHCRGGRTKSTGCIHLQRHRYEAHSCWSFAPWTRRPGSSSIPQPPPRHLPSLSLPQWLETLSF